jgi:hypothetical protein
MLKTPEINYDNSNYFLRYRLLTNIFHMHGRRPALQKREKNTNKNRGRRERLVEELKTDMEEIGEGQERIKEIRQKSEEIESERQKLKQQTMNISKQSDCNVIRMNLMLSILGARQDNSFVQADERTQLLRFVDYSPSPFNSYLKRIFCFLFSELNVFMRLPPLSLSWICGRSLWKRVSIVNLKLFFKFYINAFWQRCQTLHKRELALYTWYRRTRKIQSKQFLQNMNDCPRIKMNIFTWRLGSHIENPLLQIVQTDILLLSGLLENIDKRQR